MNIKRLASFAGCLLICAGCQTHNRAIISSFEEITSAKHEERGTFAQTHLASVNGLLPFDTVGQAYYFSAKRGVLTPIGVSAVCTNSVFHLTNTITYATIREYPCSATFSDLFSIRDAILDVSAWTGRALAAKQAYSQVVTNPVLASAWFTEWTNAVAKSDAVFAQMKNSANKENLLIFRWNANTGHSGGISGGEMVEAKGKRETAQSGYVIVAGFKTSTLYVGYDLIRQLQDDSKHHGKLVTDKIQIPTFIIAASKIVYFSQDDLAAEASLGLSGSYSQFANLPQTIKNLDKIELNYATRKLQSLSNSGMVGSPSVCMREIPMFVDVSKVSSQQEGNFLRNLFQSSKEKSPTIVDSPLGRSVCVGQEWTPFFSVLTSSKDVLKVFAEKRKN